MRMEELLKKDIFVYGGRILSNRGLYKHGINVTYSNCYVLAPPTDSIEGIYDTAKRMARVYSYGGGVGIDLSLLRPNGTSVNNSAKSTTGPVSFMRLFDTTTDIICQNGRRGALMLSMSCKHPDILEFINSKSEENQVTKANISVRMFDDFLYAAERDEKYTCKWKDVEKVVDAKGIMYDLAYNAWDTAEPGVLYWDRIQNWSIRSGYKDFEFAGVNPCIHGNSLIQTTEGNIAIKDLVGQKPFVYCMGEDGKLTIKQASNVWMSKKNASLVKIITGKGKLICTPDHRVFVKKRGWVEAQNICIKDKIVGLNRKMCDETHVAVALSGTDYEREHRFVSRHFEDITDKDVHHKNEDTFNNKWSNLEALTHGVHSIISNVGFLRNKNRCEKTGMFLPTDIKKKKDSKNQGKKVGINWGVISVEKLNYTADVYDMHVPEVHNFIANDMVVHNCGEQPLSGNGSCLLSAINLSKFVTSPFTDEAEFDFEEFKQVVRDGVTELNKVLDEGLDLHPLEEIRDNVAKWREIGLGVLGFHDMLIKMGFTYGGKRCIEIIDKIGYTMINAALQRSAELAAVQGPFPAYDEDATLSSEFIKYNASQETIEKIMMYGLRNSQLLTIAPTGSTAPLVNASWAAEPIFAISYNVKTESLHEEGEKSYSIFTPIISELMEAKGITDVKDLPDYVVTAHQIPWRRRVEVQARWQHYIDAAISSTVNVPNHLQVRDVYDLYMYAWKMGCKGITVYRDGCRREGVLTDTSGKKDDVCPACGAKLEFVEGCKSCPNQTCNYSACGI